MGHQLERPALGQKVPLGTLYDAHTDTFLGVSLFSEHPSEEAISSTPFKKSSIIDSDIDSYQGRLQLLQTGNELVASLSADLTNAGGAGRCLQNDSPTVRYGTVQHYAALCHNLATNEDSLLPNSTALRALVSPETLRKCPRATHVVIGIIRGCKTIVIARGTSQDSCTAGDDAADAPAVDVQESFKNAFLEFKSAVENLQFLQEFDLGNMHPEGMKLDVTAYSEIFDDNGMALKDLEEAFGLVRLLPAFLRNSGKHDGKGEPVMYSLLPIQTLASILGLQGRASDSLCSSMQTIPPNSSESIIGFLDHYNTLEYLHKNLLQYCAFLTWHKPYVHPEHTAVVLDTIRNVQQACTNLKQDYADMLRQDRTHGASRREAWPIVEAHQSLWMHCNWLLEQAEEQHLKIRFSRQAVKNGAIHIGYNAIDLSKILVAAADAKREVYVLYYGCKAIREDASGWDNHTELVKELWSCKSSAHSKAVIVVFDCDAMGVPLDEARITHYGSQGAVLAQDLYEQRQFMADQPLARYNTGSLENGEDIMKPVKRRMVKIPCPGPHCSSLDVCQWMCSECHSHLEFGFTDDYLYCECGRAKYSAWRFQCNSPNHMGQPHKGKAKAKGSKLGSDGYAFYAHKAQLLSMLKSLDQTDYVNILILGETGVGKSTFINSLVNYLAFETLDEAKLADELSWVIPCAFSIQMMDRTRPNGAIKERKVRVGVRDDEKDGSTGDSATQKTTVYPVNVGDKTIRLIDTPGIGDTRGLAFDKKNMADILRTLSSYEHLHGILILLKSNNSRLTVTFNFCMQELLTHLHRSASRNMAFGFTNTRISNYSPGDTFGPLTSLLEKHRDIGLVLENQNTFCFDSESFRYLAAFKNDIVLDNEEDFRRSWVHSREEAVRLVEFFQSKTPHQVKSTLSMNGTRQLIAELTKPMADISQLINTNIQLLKEQAEELQDTQLSGDKLRQRLQVAKVHLRAIKLNRPRTVCRNKDCVEWRDNGAGELQGVYKKPCHDPCGLGNVEVDRINCPELMSCAAFMGNGGFCIIAECGHSWQEHLHICYELEEYTALVTDTEAQRLFAQNESDIVVKQAALVDIEELIKEYREEHAQIQEAAARFGIFLKQHSITPYNDATLEYLDMLIDEEKQKAIVRRDKTKLTALQASYATHVELVKTLESSMVINGSTGGGTQLDEAGVEALVRELYELAHFGTMLRDVKDGITEAYEATYRERPVKVQASRRRTVQPSQRERKRVASLRNDTYGGHMGSPQQYNRGPMSIQRAVTGVWHTVRWWR